MEETTDDQNTLQNQETYEETYDSLNATLENVNDETMLAVASITDTKPNQEQQEHQTMNVTIIQEQQNSTTQTTNQDESKGNTTKPDDCLKQIMEHMKALSEKIEKIEKQNLNQQNNSGNPLNNPLMPSNSQ